MIFIKNNREKGFLLIDALVAMLILTIALIAIVGAITSASKLSSVNDDLMQANKLAQSSMEKMKQIKASTWKEIVKEADTDYTVGPVIDNLIELPSSSEDKKFTCTNFAKMNSSVTTGTHLVTVRSEVTWTSTTQSGLKKDNKIVLIGYCERQED